MTPPLHQPGTLDEAVALLADCAEPMVYAGGTAIQILLKQGLLFASDLIDVSRVPGLDGLTETDTGLRAGAMVPIRQLERSAVTRSVAPLAARCYAHVANPRVRNTATIGGNIAHGDYRLDPPGALLALDATVEAASVRGLRRIPVRDFFVDFQQTALEPDEIVTAIEIPRQPAGAGWHYAKLSSLSENDWPAASAAALLYDGGDGTTLVLGIGALAPTPQLARITVNGHDEDGAVDLARQQADALMDPIPDVRGSTSYKRRLGLVAVEDAVRHAWEDRRSA
jgi:carbon-monoxide dehydrogenase medium subunit